MKRPRSSDRPGITTALQERNHVNHQNPLPARLQLWKCARLVDGLAAPLRRPRWALLGAALFAVLIPFAGVSSAQAAGPEWKLTVTPNADYFITTPGHFGAYTVEAENVGGQQTSGEISVSDLLPPGLGAAEVLFFPESACPTLTECRYSGVVRHGEKLVMVLLATVTPGPEAPLEDIATVSGGGAPDVQATATNFASPEPAFGSLEFAAALTDSSKHTPYTQAGGRPYQFTADFDFETLSAVSPAEDGNQDSFPFNGTADVRDPRAIGAELPPGLIANPQAVPHCSLADWFSQTCERKKVAVGDACIGFRASTHPACKIISPIFNLQPSGSYPGQLGITVANAPFIVVDAGIRSATDYGVSAVNLSPAANLNRAYLTFWGVPANESHNGLRGKECIFSAEREGVAFLSIAALESKCAAGEPGNTTGTGGPAEVPETPFFTMPTECSGQPLTISGNYNSWEAPEEYASARSPPDHRPRRQPLRP